MIIHKTGDCLFIDHHKFIKNLYKNVSTDEGPASFSLLANLFSIVKDKKIRNNRKRTRDAIELHDEAVKVKVMYEEFLKDLPSQIIEDTINNYKKLETPQVRDLAKQLFEATSFNHNMNGGNNSDIPLKCKLNDEYFLIPNRSRFYCGCVRKECPKLDGTKFDMVVADPPWWNKYIRRLKNANDTLSYPMMYNEEIASLPIKGLISDNCLIAVWCTNSPSNIDDVKTRIFPQWGAKYIGSWYWLKVTVDLQPVCQFGSGAQKQPYERLMLGKVGEIGAIPECQLIVSVPSALHSHKPPLLDILSQYVKVERPHTLELFARYLLPDTTSVGYEPLKWQHTSLYESVN